MTRQTGISMLVLGFGLALMAMLALATLILAKIEVGSWQSIMSIGTVAVGIGLIVIGFIALLRNKK